MRPAPSRVNRSRTGDRMRIFIAAFIGAFVANRIYHALRDRR